MTTKVAIDISAYTNVTVQYTRRTNSYDSGEYMKTEWSNGTTWTMVEQTNITAQDVGGGKRCDNHPSLSTEVGQVGDVRNGPDLVRRDHADP